MTNHHVINGCGVIEVVSSDGRRPATVVDSVKQIDLALLRVYGMRGGVASLRTQSPVRLGESATVFGFPLGSALSSTGNFTTGVVSSLRGLRDAAGEIQITAPVQPGNSGGPVLDRAGIVIGVVQSKLDALYAVKMTGDIPQNVNFAVSLDVLADFLEKNSVSFRPSAAQPALESTQIAEMAQTFTYKISCTLAPRTASVSPPKSQVPAPAAPIAPTPIPDKLVQAIQEVLNQKGFNAGTADGFIGQQTVAAIKAAQRALGLSEDGMPSKSLYDAINKLNNKNIYSENSSNTYSEFYSKVRLCVKQNLSSKWGSVTSLINNSSNPSVSMDITINANGRVVSVLVVGPSGIDSFDNLVVLAVQKCNPFPKPPNRSWPLTLPINYKLRD